MDSKGMSAAARLLVEVLDTGTSAINAECERLERERMLERASEVARTGAGAPSAATVAAAHRGQR